MPDLQILGRIARPHGVRGELVMDADRTAADRLAEIETPTLVVMGDKDPDFKDPAAEAGWIAGQLKGSVVMVPGAGHYPHAQDPERVNAAILELIARSAATTPAVAGA